MKQRVSAMGIGGLIAALLVIGGAQAGHAQAAPLAPSTSAPTSAPLSAPPQFQPVSADRLIRALRIDMLADVLAAEIAASDDPLGDAASPDAAPDEGWAAMAAVIAPTDRVWRGLRDGITAEMAALDDPAARADLGQALAFWESPLGQRTLELEHSARRALAEPGAEAAARAAFDAAAARGAPRVDQVRRLMADADLLEPAVAASLNIALASMQGIRDSSGFPADDADLAQDVWLQEPEIRADQAGWLEALLFLATGPLTDAEMDRLIAEASSPGAQRLNRIVDAAATAAFIQIARDLGAASARRLADQRL